MASSSSATWKYDVFLNFRGIDTRHGFTSFLYEALRLAEINTFIDKRLERGEEISGALLQDIENSSIFVVIFSQNYAFSSYCLDELVKIIECKKSTGRSVFPVFYKVDPTDIEELRGSYDKAFAKHEAKYKEDEEKRGKWKSALQEAVNLSGWHITDEKKAPKCIKRIVKTIKNKLIEEKKEKHKRKRQEVQENDEALPTKELVSQEFQSDMDLILEWLSSDEVSMIGIYGMGGVGKTTLVTHIYNNLLKDPSKFPCVYWVTMSQDFSVYKLQSLIAKTIKINLDIEQELEGDVRKRAARLSKELNRRHKWVLILDDLWNHFDVTEAGIPVENNGRKLIFTTRSIEVCRRTKCQRIKKVELLKKEEAWELFVKTFGNDLSPNFEMIAKSIVKECAGLPLAIVTIAGSMRGVDDLHEWTNALMELQRSITRQEDMGEGVFQVLRYSYTRLNDPALQQCLLYCALFPEDYLITRPALIHYLIVEGIIDQERDTRQEKFDKGCTMLNKLENVSLLERVDNEYVKMHDLIRDMAIQIMKECLPSIVEPGKQLKCLPDEMYWRKNIVRVSLVMNEINEIPSNFSPSCPNLSTLLLSENRGLLSIADSFFDQLQGLKVLDLSGTNIGELPESVAGLKNLTALFSRDSSLSYIPTLANLKSMELLDLSDCFGMKKVPKDLEFLSNLRYLNLLFSGIMEFPAGILPKLSHLQLLAFHKPSKNARELGGLRRLETLYWCFPTIGDLKTFLHLLPRKQIEYTLCVGPELIRFDLDEKGRKVILNECTVTRELRELQVEIDILSLINVSLEHGRDLCPRNPIGLKSLRVINCGGIEYLFNLSTSLSIFESLETLYVLEMDNLSIIFSNWEMIVPRLPYSAVSFRLKELYVNLCSVKKLLPDSLLPILQNLETIQVTDCKELEEIISGEESFQTLLLSLPNLRRLFLSGLPKLKSICSRQIKCSNLQSIYIYGCEELKNVSISLPLPYVQSIKVSPRKWWETVKWGQLDQKDALPVDAGDR